MPVNVIHITEPHPTVTHKYTHAGRGGAGNYFQPPPNITASYTASGPASLAPLPPPPSNGKFSAGRGGAGNVHRNTERASFTLEDELERQQTREQRDREGSVFHVGRGGAGNLINERRVSSGSSRKGSMASVASDSSEGSSHSSRKSGVLSRLGHKIKKETANMLM